MRAALAAAGLDPLDATSRLATVPPTATGRFGRLPAATRRLGLIVASFDHTTIERAAQLKLRAVGREEQLKRHLMVMLTVQTMNVVHSGYYRIAL